MYHCKIKTHRYDLYKKTIYTVWCNGELTLGKFGNRDVYICTDCGAIFSKDYVEWNPYMNLKHE